MPALWTDLRALSAQELTRMAAAVAGTYVVPVASGGAVTASANMTLAVAAITTGTGLQVNGVHDTTGYAGGTTVIATADPTNPRRDYVWYDGAGAIGNTSGTAAVAPVLPDLTAGRIALAEIYVAAGDTTISGASEIVDRRHNVALTPRLLSNVAAATSTTSTSAVDLVTISGLTIPVTAGIRITFNWRKQALAANAVGFGLKLNATVVVEATITNSSVSHSTATSQAEDGYCIIDIVPRSSANYVMGGLQSMHGSKVSGTGAAGFPNAVGASIMTAAVPNATITSVIIRAINDTASNAAEVTSVLVLQIP